MSHDYSPPAQVGSAVGLSAASSDVSCVECLFFGAIVMWGFAIYSAYFSTDRFTLALAPFFAVLGLFFAGLGVLILYVKSRLRNRRH